jgi:hypothetical protein
MKTELKQFKLLRDIPGLKAGAIFYYDPNDSIRGSIGLGCLKLAWRKGDCQQSWCADTFIFPGQLADNSKWFKKIPETYEHENNISVMEQNFGNMVVRTTIEKD